MPSAPRTRIGRSCVRMASTSSFSRSSRPIILGSGGKLMVASGAGASFSRVAGRSSRAARGRDPRRSTTDLCCGPSPARVLVAEAGKRTLARRIVEAEFEELVEVTRLNGIGKQREDIGDVVGKVAHVAEAFEVGFSEQRRALSRQRRV